jgi:SAM-dependent methyltransferase
LENNIYNSKTLGQLYLSGSVVKKRVLLLGSGCGRNLLSLFKNEPSEVVCVDTNDKVLAKVNELAREANAQDLVRTVKLDANQAGNYFPKGGFDTILVVKSLGQIYKGESEMDLRKVLASWSTLLTPDGVLVVDVQTFSDRAACFKGGMEEILSPGEELDIATFGGRYPDTLYSLSALGDFGCELMFYWVPVPRDGPQEWAQYWYIRRPSPVTGIRNIMDYTEQHPLKDLLPPVMEMKSNIAYPTLVPSEARGTKLWLTSHMSRRVAVQKIYPKYDGQTALCMFNGSRAIIMSDRLLATVDLAEPIDVPVSVLCELCTVTRGSFVGTTGRTACIITGVVAYGGVATNSVNDMASLSLLSPYTALFARSGFMITSPKQLTDLRGNFVKIAYCPNENPGWIEIPVDGLNLPLGGFHGNFLKPHNLSSMDVRLSDLGDLPVRLTQSLGLNFIPTFGGVPWDAEDKEEDMVWEYASGDGGRTWRAMKPRYDKVTSVTFNRAVRDLMGAFKGFVDAPGVDTVAKMYGYLSLQDRAMRQ